MNAIRPAARPAAELRLAAIVPATDAPATLQRCTTALRGGERVAEELLVERGPARGPAAARNAAAARADADVLVFVDSDVEVHADALARIERRFVADPGLAAVFGAYDDEPAAPGLASRFRNLLHHHVHVSSAGPAETFWAGLGAVRRDAFRQIGGFDAERFPHPSVEDIELGMRLRASGMRVTLDPAIRGRHLKQWTPLGIVRTDFLRRGVPWARLLLEGGGGGASLNLGWRQRLSAVAAVLLAAAALARRPHPALAALLAMLGLNRRFYVLLARRGGAPLLAAGIPLHLLHQLTAAAAVPAALALHLSERGALVAHRGTKTPHGGRS